MVMKVGAICYKPQAGDCAEMPQSLALKTIALACIFIIARCCFSKPGLRRGNRLSNQFTTPLRLCEAV
jgi:hypothetical protein